MRISNSQQLERVMKERLKGAIVSAQEKVYQVIDKFLKQYYAEYTPMQYDRTYQLLRSLVKSEIINNGKDALDMLTDLMNRDRRSEIGQTINYEHALLQSRRNIGMKRVITYGTYDLHCKFGIWCPNRIL